MLEVKNLSKIYKAKNKGGVDTKALDNVSLSFSETGMVFLLGKSGSGKSTLLNICGGLDAPTSGEVIVKGKSSKDFTQTDFDSYRNTFVGFIFQEYNILNEFSVEDNIALALELQGKPKDKKTIADLLEQVDLSGFAKRKPNTLSGGQKQRIAIARALVKSPEIIMADEPTGALDSATGKQVFDTLKKLSKDKLVLVVSHDREFAEQYGDRIIELKDGKILTDVSKTEKPQQAVSKNVSTIGDVLCIKKDAELGEQDFEQIKAFLKASKTDVIIANNEKDVSKFKKASRITDSGAKEIFVDTDGDKIEKKNYKPEDSRFIRSKLPMRHAVKIGASSLKSKPFRLALTIILCAVSFVLFGLLSTLNFYDSESTFKQTLVDMNREYVVLEKEYQMNVIGYSKGEKDYEYLQSANGVFSKEEIESIKADFGEDVFGAIRTSIDYSVRTKPNSYWYTNISSVASLQSNHPLIARINGSYPKNDDEICISSYSAEMLVACKAMKTDGTQIDVSSPNELIGKTIRIGTKDYKITGIFDSGAIDPKFESIKTDTDINFALMNEFDSHLNDGLHLVAFVTENELNNINKNYGQYNYFYTGDSRNAFVRISLEGFSNEKNYDNYPNGYYKDLTTEKVMYFDPAKTSISDNEVVLSVELITRTLAEYIHEKISEFEQSDKFDHTNPEYQKMRTLLDDVYALQSNMVNEFDSDGNYKGERELTAAEYKEKLERVVAAFKDVAMTVEFAPSDSSMLAVSEPKTYKVVGIISDQPTQDHVINNSAYFTKAEADKHWELQKGALDHYMESITKYVAPENGVYNLLYTSYAGTDNQTDMLWELYSNDKFDDKDSKVSLNGHYIDRLESIDSMVKELSKVFLYVGLVLAAFAILLFSNFISVSISQKKREIGILRAVGARGTDVFKIFFSESFFIAMICVLISTIGSVVICELLNKSLAAELGASIFVFGIASFVVIIAIAVLTALISTFLPVWSAAKKKPVDSIRSL